MSPFFRPDTFAASWLPRWLKRRPQKILASSAASSRVYSSGFPSVWRLPPPARIPLGFMLPVMGGGLPQGGAPDLLVDFGQLAHHCEPSLAAEDAFKIIQGSGSLWGLRKDHGAGFLGYGEKMFPAASLVHAEKAFKGEAAGGQAAYRQRRDHRRGAWNHVNRNIFRCAGCHQRLARIGDGGHARVRYQRACFPSPQAAKDQLPRSSLLCSK